MIWLENEGDGKSNILSCFDPVRDNPGKMPDDHGCSDLENEYQDEYPRALILHQRLVEELNYEVTASETSAQALCDLLQLRDISFMTHDS